MTNPTPATRSFAAWLQDGTERRDARLRRLWQMSAAQRVAAMRRGELTLTLEQLAAWSARHPEQIPIVNGDYEWIAGSTPEACE